jgi:hypothetical protein
LLIIFGLGVAYFATQNTGNVHILLGTYLISGIPLYILVIGSMLLGVFMSWLISMVNAFSVLFSIHKRDTALKHSEKEIKNLEEKNHELEMELARITGKNPQTPDEEVEEDPDRRPSFFHHMSQRFGFVSK